jgi:predicted DNA-binding protein (UPF0251 family)
MARPTKWRKIENIPVVLNFIPSEKAGVQALENSLKLEELEAVRLKDLEGLEQEECAARMQVSRPTFQRILLSAREKIADSLVNGKAIRIEGGKFTRNICPLQCLDCGKEWTDSCESLESPESGLYSCPACGSTKIVCRQPDKENFCRGRCRRRRGNRESL